MDVNVDVENIVVGLNQWPMGRYLMKNPEFENLMRLSLLKTSPIRRFSRIKSAILQNNEFVCIMAEFMPLNH
jgi:hypothetical protein